MLILIAGLPRSGKSSFAQAIASMNLGYTHVSLDKYLLEIPEGLSFLNWVASPQCIDWKLLQEHLQLLAAGQACYTPDPDWEHRGQRRSAGGLETGAYLMQPATRSYLLPGSYAFHFPAAQAQPYRVFVNTPHAMIAERLVGHPVDETEVRGILDQRLSPNWPAIEDSARTADLVLAGDQPHTTQAQIFFDALQKRDNHL